jgi:TetR/AcrR family transcriptional regulator, transcriptional repressor for nem operon
MPYPAEHKQEIRKRILESARKLFNRNGLTEISIDQIMGDAGLTRGAFYSHFTNKEELYAEAITHFIRAESPPHWQSAALATQPRCQSLARAILDAYLSRDHLEDVEGSCPMIGLATDVARSSGATKAAYRQVLAMMAGIFAENMGPNALAASDHRSDPGADQQRALALVAMCVGGMVLARAIDDPAIADDLRTAAHPYGVALAGWSDL